MKPRVFLTIALLLTTAGAAFAALNPTPSIAASPAGLVGPTVDDSLIVDPYIDIVVISTTAGGGCVFCFGEAHCNNHHDTCPCPGQGRCHTHPGQGCEGTCGFCQGMFGCVATQ